MARLSAALDFLSAALDFCEVLVNPHRCGLPHYDRYSRRSHAAEPDIPQCKKALRLDAPLSHRLEREANMVGPSGRKGNGRVLKVEKQSLA